MRHLNTVFHQLMKHLPWGEFERLVEEHGADAQQRGFTTKTQLVAMIYAQLAGAVSLRDIEAGLGSHEARRYHLGVGRVRRSTLGEANAHRPVGVFSGLFAALVRQASRSARAASSMARPRPAPGQALFDRCDLARAQWVERALGAVFGPGLRCQGAHHL